MYVCKSVCVIKSPFVCKCFYVFGCLCFVFVRMFVFQHVCVSL